MTSIPSFIWKQLVKDAYKWRVTDKGENFRDWNQIRLSCGNCGIMMEAYSLRHHMESIHRRNLDQTREVDTGVRERETYLVSFPHIMP